MVSQHWPQQPYLIKFTKISGLCIPKSQIYTVLVFSIQFKQFIDKLMTIKCFSYIDQQIYFLLTLSKISTSGFLEQTDRFSCLDKALTLLTIVGIVVSM